MASHPRNTEAMVTKKKEQSAIILRRIEDTITMMLREGRAINPNLVSKVALVSKTTLYNHANIMMRIRSINEDPAYQSRIASEASPQGKSEKSKDVIICAKDRMIKSLQTEVKRLSKEVDMLRLKAFEEL